MLPSHLYIKTSSLTESGEGKLGETTTLDEIIIFVKTIIFVPTEEYPKLLDRPSSATVELLASVCVAVWSGGSALCVRVMNESVCGYYFFFLSLLLLFYLYVYVDCSKFSPSTNDILTNITCYVVNNTLIKDATLSV